MILDGGQRGGARDLAVHLMKPENEHIELHEIRGFSADTLRSALIEAEAISKGTRCRQFLYSLSLSPPTRERVPVSAFENAIETTEARLGLNGHARVVVFHEKKGRRHAHCVWLRVNQETMKAVRMSHDRRKLGDISRQLFFEHEWKMPEGLIDRELRNPLNFDQKEWFQAKRVGQDPRDIKNAFQQCWAASDSGKALQSALEQRGYWLAHGDRRGVVAVDIHGGIYSLARWTNLKTKDVRARVRDLDQLPSVEEVRGRVARLVHEKLAGFADSAAEEFARAAQSLEGRRIAMVDRHRAERSELQEKQNQRHVVESRARADRFRKGLRGLWDRVMGRHSRLRAQNEEGLRVCAQRNAEETERLIGKQLNERLRLQAAIDAERRAYVRGLSRLYRTNSPERADRNRKPIRPGEQRRRDFGPR